MKNSNVEGIISAPHFDKEFFKVGDAVEVNIPEWRLTDKRNVKLKDLHKKGIIKDVKELSIKVLMMFETGEGIYDANAITLQAKWVYSGSVQIQKL